MYKHNSEEIIDRLHRMRESRLRACAEKAVDFALEHVTIATDEAALKLIDISGNVLSFVSRARTELERPSSVSGPAEGVVKDKAIFKGESIVNGEPIPLTDRLDLQNPNDIDLENLARFTLASLEGAIRLPAKDPRTEKYVIAIGVNHPTDDLLLCINRSEMGIEGLKRKHFSDELQHPNGVYYSMSASRVPKVPR
jgi:hypothetical protein